MNFTKRQSGEFARRLALSFTIDDPTLGELPQDGAMELKDTPELRAELYEAYKELYTAFATNDVQGYGEQMALILNRFGYVRGYAGREDEVLAVQVENNPLRGGEGETLPPLPSRDALMNGQLLWGAHNRMVAFAVHPIDYVDSGDKKAGAIRVMFCKKPDGPLYACHQQ